MKLSTQLARGVLALPMLLGFGLLAMAGLDPTTARAAEQVASTKAASPVRVLRVETLHFDMPHPDARQFEELASRALAEVAQACEARIGPRVLLLSQAPGDLGRLAVRFSHPCRA